MMRSIFKEYKLLLKEFGVKKVLDSVLGGIVYSSLVFIPVYIVLAEILIVMMYRVNTLTILLIVAAMGHVVLLHHLTKNALYLKLPEARTNIGKLTLFSMAVINILVLVLGLVILFVMIPRWMV